MNRGDLIFRKVGAAAIPDTAGLQGDDNLKTYLLPYRWLTFDAAGTERLLVPKLILHGSGLTYDPVDRVFRGLAMIGVEDSLNPGQGRQPLARPVLLQLNLTGPGDVLPNQLAIDHTSLEYDSVVISARDSVAIRIQTATDPAGVLVPVQIFRPTIRLSASPSVLQGLGLGTSKISIALPPGFARSDTIAVRVHSKTLNVRPDLIRVTADGNNEATFRSGLPGQHTIIAEIDGMQAASMDVSIVLPWLVASAMLLGILLGAWAVWATGRAGYKNYFTAVKRAAPFGIIAALASAVGLDLFGLHLDDAGTWTAVLFLAAIGAYLGERVLSHIVHTP